MANICSLMFVLYVDDKDKLKNLEKANQNIENVDFGVDFVKDTITKKGDLYYCEYYGWCKWSLDYELVNSFCSSFNVKWASVEEEPGNEYFVINDEEGFFDDVKYRVEENDIYSLSDFYEDLNEVFYLLKENEVLRNEKESFFKIEQDLKTKGVCNLSYEETNADFLVEKEDFYLKIYQYKKDNSNFWWNKKENVRIIALSSFEGVYNYKTNASNKIIFEAITHIEELKSNNETDGLTDFEILENYLNERGFFINDFEIETIEW